MIQRALVESVYTLLYFGPVPSFDVTPTLGQRTLEVCVRCVPDIFNKDVF